MTESVPTSPNPTRRRPVRRRRWHRAAIPLGLALLLFAITGITYAAERADPADPKFLSPLSEADIGSRDLADRLRARGVTVQRTTNTTTALNTAAQGSATLFVPVPAVMNQSQLRALAFLPSTTRVVLVEPSWSTLVRGGLPLATAGRRWAARAATADTEGARCALPEAEHARVAAALRQRYRWIEEGPQPDRCYGNGLFRLRWHEVELVVIGAADPFRNDRINEHNNAKLAVGLLASRPLVVWLDRHEPEPAPPAADNDVEPPSKPPSASEQETPNPLWGAFPPWLWALLAQLALAALVYALWRARRLGAPVAEPLPVTVRSAETVLGRSRLYQRARDRKTIADILRSAALRRIRPMLGLPPEAPPDEVVAAVARQTGRDPDGIDDALYGPDPDTDDDLLHLARTLDELPHLLNAPSPRPSDRTDEGDNR